MNVELLETISNLSGKTEKVNLIKQFDQELADVVVLALDPSITFGITVDEDHVTDPMFMRSPRTPAEFWSAFSDLATSLAARALTGNAAFDKTYEILSTAPDVIAAKWASRILNRNLRAGFDISSFNKARGADSIKKFGVQLADVYDPETELSGTWFVEPKLDGNRVTLLDGQGWSRNGKVYAQAQPLADEIEKVIPDFFQKYVLDGEMMGDLGFDKSSGALRRTSGERDAKFTYWAFDIVDRDQWEKRATDAFITRRRQLESVVARLEEAGVLSVKLVTSTKVEEPTHTDIMKFVDDMIAAGFEGAMLKDGQSPYVFKRGRNVLKVKKFFDIDVKVVGVYEGKGRNRGRLGGLRVEADGVESKVGSGFDDELRRTIWQTSDEDEWIGAVVQVQYQELTAAGSLRFPVFIMRRRDKE